MSQAPLQGRSGTLRDVDSTPLREVLNEVADFNRKYIYHANEAVHDVIALWVAHTYVMDRLSITPRLYITAPQAGAGKSTQGKVVQYLSRGGVKVSSGSPAYLFGSITDSKGKLTILLGEADNIWSRGKDTAELQSLVNDGYEYGAKVGRGTADKGGEVKGITYDAFCPVAIIGIQNSFIPDTTLSRCIQIDMTLPANGERPQRMIARRVLDDAKALADRINLATVQVEAQYDLEPPEHMSAREWDIWEPMFMVAASAGEEWLERVTRAAQAMAGGEPRLSAAQRVVQRVHRALLESTDHTAQGLAEHINSENDFYFELDSQAVRRYLNRYQITTRKSNGLRVYDIADVATVMERWKIPSHTPPFNVPERPSTSLSVQDTDSGDVLKPATSATSATEDDYDVAW